ncbi:dsRNA-specific ribonuclease [Leptolyngbyaceae cyanobacterium CCMR0082]|uniref:DsRNA-specific ribonuclease n=1 Tax=Adonisia turfae CCMR0082 TaxID=2304604 RepID=A0A6M0SAQ4_9CYAN|nr:ribonuclease III domain-containing protein [Adonisia turfae]NEZ65540.1 dsRNA-specific ribonuclease [Adonisia turfae CCMR0082]
MMTPEEIRAIEIRLGYLFLDQGLLLQALTRKAAAQEQRQKGKQCEDQEIFRTLGDAVLKAILTDLLIQKGYSTRGSITQKKEKLEKEESLSAMLRAMEITPIVGIGERSIGVHEQSLALAETFEAIVAAIYKDGGYEIIKNLVVKWFSPLIEQ